MEIRFMMRFFCLFKYESTSLFHVSKAKVVSPQDQMNCINIHNLNRWSLYRDVCVMSNGICFSWKSAG